jgi:hypothetical protein
MNVFKERSISAKADNIVIRWLNFRTKELIANKAIFGRNSFNKYCPIAL